VGGALIGLACVGLLAWNGRIAGISGIAGGLWFNTRAERVWRGLFLLGLVVGVGTWTLWRGLPSGASASTAPSGLPPALLVLAGLLVGYGTSLAGGCTSGHGVCGLGRLSLRSAVATGVFVLVAMATTFIVRHRLGLS
jgi:hypothetical protein